MVENEAYVEEPLEFICTPLMERGEMTIKGIMAPYDNLRSRYRGFYEDNEELFEFPRHIFPSGFRLVLYAYPILTTYLCLNYLRAFVSLARIDLE